MSIRKKIFLNTIVRWTGEIIGKIGWFVFTLSIARKLGRIDFGYFSYAFSLGSFFVVFSDLGTNLLITREVSKDRNKINFLLGNVLFIKFIISLLIYFFVLVVSYFIKENYLVTIIIVLSLIINSFLDPFNSLYRADKKLYLETVIVLIWRLMIVVIGIVGIYFFNFNLLNIAILFLVVGLLSVVITYIIADKEYKFNFKIGKNFCGDILKESFPLGMIMIFGAVFFKLNTVILQYLSGANDVGIYSAAFKLIEGSFFISTIFSYAIFPYFCELSKECNSKIIGIFSKAFIVLFLISIIVFILLYFFSEKIVNFLYGKEFIYSVDSLKIIVFGLIFIFLNELYSYFFVSLNMHRLVNKILLFCAILYIALNIFLIKIFDKGFLGASWSLVIIQMVIFLLYSINFLYFRKNLKCFYE